MEKLISKKVSKLGRGQTSPHPCLVVGVKRVSVLRSAKQLRPLPTIRSPKSLREGAVLHDSGRNAGEVKNISCVSTVKNLLPQYLSALVPSKKAAFTLAEVLITLAIIGVVAAMTIPTLVSKYQKHVYYTQFRKAATVIDNAVQRYNFENGCDEKIVNDNLYYGMVFYNNLCWINGSDGYPNYHYLADRLGSMMNVVQWITHDNYQEICKKSYDKLPPAMNYDGSDRKEYADLDITEIFCNAGNNILYNNGYGFITNDGMLILFNEAADINFVDTNGPNKGPNTFGRDIFAFSIISPISERWGRPKEYDNGCFDDNKDGRNCGIRLLQEGKMNY